MIESWQLLLLTGTAVIAGTVNVIAGGGSLLTIPIMVFLGIPGPVANGTNRIAILAQSITAVIAFFRKGYADFRLSLSLSLCAMPGTVAGALLGTRLEGVWFNRVLALVMVGVILIMQLDQDTDRPGRATGTAAPRNLLAGHLLMVLVGCFGGFIQVGVGFIFMPVLHRVMGMDLVTANMHKVFIIGCYTIVALLIFALRVEILWLTGLCLALGSSAGAWLGTHISISKGEPVIRWVLNITLCLFIIKLLFF